MIGDGKYNLKTEMRDEVVHAPVDDGSKVPITPPQFIFPQAVLAEASAINTWCQEKDHLKQIGRSCASKIVRLHSIVETANQTLLKHSGPGNKPLPARILYLEDMILGSSRNFKQLLTECTNDMASDLDHIAKVPKYQLLNREATLIQTLHECGLITVPPLPEQSKNLKKLPQPTLLALGLNYAELPEFHSDETLSRITATKKAITLFESLNAFVTEMQTTKVERPNHPSVNTEQGDGVTWQKADFSHLGGPEFVGGEGVA